MGKHVYKGVERYNQLNYGHSTPENICCVIDDNQTLTIFTLESVPFKSYAKLDNVFKDARKGYVKLDDVKMAVRELRHEYRYKHNLDYKTTCLKQEALNDIHTKINTLEGK